MSISSIDFSLSSIFMTVFSLVEVVIIAGDERRRSHRRWIGVGDFAGNNWTVKTDVVRIGVTAVSDSFDKELLLFLFKWDWWRYW